MLKKLLAVWLLAAMLLLGFPLAADWTTFGADPQRTCWEEAGLDNGKQVDSGGRLLTSEERATPTGNATLYALDAETGKELYSMGKTMPGFSRLGAPVVSGGRVYVATFDNMVYACGLGQQQ